MSKITPLRQVRDALSTVEGKVVTQAMLAKRLGVSASYINAIEAGSKTATPDLAMRINDMWGIDAASLLPPSKQAVHQYTPDLAHGIRSWTMRQNFDFNNKKAAARFFDQTIPNLNLLVNIALEEKKASFLVARIEHSIKEWVLEFKLQKQFTAAWKKRTGWPGDNVPGLFEFLFGDLFAPDGHWLGMAHGTEPPDKRRMALNNFYDAARVASNTWQAITKEELERDPEGVNARLEDALWAMETCMCDAGDDIGPEERKNIAAVIAQLKERMRLYEEERKLRAQIAATRAETATLRAEIEANEVAFKKQNEENRALESRLRAKKARSRPSA